MASIKMIPEEVATGKVKEIYTEIKSELGIDFVPNLYKVMASKPDYLDANWSTFYCQPYFFGCGLIRRRKRGPNIRRNVLLLGYQVLSE